MREILFRGKRKDNGEWFTGFLNVNPFYKNAIIESPESPVCYNVIHETVGEYIGLLDCKGQRIFEGDLIQQQNYCGNKNEEIGAGEYTAIFEVVHDGPGFCLKMLKGNEKAMAIMKGAFFSFGYYENNKLKKGEVIGNRFDNPELLEAKNGQ